MRKAGRLMPTSGNPAATAALPHSAKVSESAAARGRAISRHPPAAPGMFDAELVVEGLSCHAHRAKSGPITTRACTPAAANRDRDCRTGAAIVRPIGPWGLAVRHTLERVSRPSDGFCAAAMKPSSSWPYRAFLGVHSSRSPSATGPRPRDPGYAMLGQEAGGVRRSHRT